MKKPKLAKLETGGDLNQISKETVTKLGLTKKKMQSDKVISIMSRAMQTILGRSSITVATEKGEKELTKSKKGTRNGIATSTR